MRMLLIILLSVTSLYGQTPSDFQVLNTRNLEIGISYKPERRKDIEFVQLYLSRDQGQTWEAVASVPPTKDVFNYTIKEDGLYFVNMVTVYRNGERFPADVSRVPPSQKLVIDSTKPIVKIDKAERQGKEILIEWTVIDKFPNEASTQVYYKEPSAASWTPAPSGSIVGRRAKFSTVQAGSLIVQVATQDVAGNANAAAREVNAAVVAVEATQPLPPSELSGTNTVNKLSVPSFPVDSPGLPDVKPGIIEVPRGPVLPGELTPPSQPLPEVKTLPEPRREITLPTTTPDPERKPLASSNEPNPPAESLTTWQDPVPDTKVQYLNVPRFGLSYQLENGPSGIARIDLYVTRDHGKTWQKWSQHDGKESPLQVVLDTRFNRQVEGDYGFRLVPISGAGISAPLPKSGDAPEMKIHLDVTAPVIKVYPPTADPTQKNSLILHWIAEDKNFSSQPLLIEYSEQPQGPWKTIVTDQQVIPVALAEGSSRPVLANTGKVAWKLPATLSNPKVYLRFTAWDRAGNKSQVATPNPILVDLTRPTAKIQGIIPAVGIKP